MHKIDAARHPPLLTSWIADRVEWFRRNPGREFQLAQLTPAELSELAMTGLVVGAFDGSLRNGVETFVELRGHQMAILRRSELDPGFRVLLFPELPSRLMPAPEREETRCSQMWAIAQWAEMHGLSMRQLAERTPEIVNRKLPSLH